MTGLSGFFQAFQIPTRSPDSYLAPFKHLVPSAGLGAGDFLSDGLECHYPLLQIVDGRWVCRWSPQNHPASVKPGLEKGGYFRSVQCWFGIPHLSTSSFYPIPLFVTKKNHDVARRMGRRPAIWKRVAFFGRLRQWQPHQVLSRLFEAQRPQVAQCRIWVGSRMGVLLYYAILYPQSHHGNSMGTPLWLGFGTSFFDRHPIHRLIIIPTNNAANDGYT